MKVHFLGILFVCGILSSASAEALSDYPGFTPIANFQDFKKKFIATTANVKTLQGDFKQEKTLSALTEKITSFGKLWFKRDSKVRMDYSRPFVYKMIINGDKMFIRDDQKESQINVRSNKLFQQVNRIMIDCMQGTILESKDFTTRVFENESAYLMEFTPVSKTLSQYLSTIVLVIEKKDSTPRSIMLNEPSGDQTLITLSNKIVNGSLQDEVFSF
jgi:outer membrane lipoprotein-sorting protein